MRGIDPLDIKEALLSGRIIETYPKDKRGESCLVHQCGEQYIPGKWAENIGEILRNENNIVPDEIMSVPVVALHEKKLALKNIN